MHNSAGDASDDECKKIFSDSIGDGRREESVNWYQSAFVADFQQANCTVTKDVEDSRLLRRYFGLNGLDERRRIKRRNDSDRNAASEKPPKTLKTKKIHRIIIMKNYKKQMMTNFFAWNKKIKLNYHLYHLRRMCWPKDLKELFPVISL